MIPSLGLLRSLYVYRRPGRQRALRRLYRPFISPGDLVFDVGAHLGDRSSAFAALGARVVAVEPEPGVARWLRRFVGNDPRIIIRTEALGPSPGTALLALSRDHPTLSTLAHSWRERITAANPGFQDVRWEESVEVTVTTLDALVAEHGVPSFCKIDVEGFEAEVLAGLSQPLAALSVEFVSGSLEVALACLERLQELGSYRFNAIAGEGRSFLWDDWRPAAAIQGWLEAGADRIPSGDLYARLPPSTPRDR